MCAGQQYLLLPAVRLAAIQQGASIIAATLKALTNSGGFYTIAVEASPGKCLTYRMGVINRETQKVKKVTKRFSRCTSTLLL
jgi:hypothetical protein